jgi:hypothetical protein
LSFSTIGTSTKPYPLSKSINNEFVVIKQDRFLDDSALPRTLRKILFNWNLFLFRLIFLFIHHLSRFCVSDKKYYEKKRAGQKLNLYQSFLAECAEGLLPKLLFQNGDFTFVYLHNKNDYKSDLDKQFGEVYILSAPTSRQRLYYSNLISKKNDYQDIKTSLSKLAVVRSEFELARNGIVRLFDFHIENVEIGKLLTIKPSSGSVKLNFEHKAACQIYYYLKDLTHQHQHHDSKSDTLLPLIKASEDKFVAELSKQVLGSLYRVILKMRRTDSLADYYSMKGIMAYIKSFKKIVHKLDETTGISELYSDDGDSLILESLKVKADSIRTHSDMGNRYKAMLPSLLSLVIAAMSIIYAFTSLVILSNRELHSDHLRNADNIQFFNDLYIERVEFIKFFIQNSLEICTIFLAALLLFFFLISDWFKHLKFRQDLIRLAYGFKNKNVLASFVTLFGIGLMFISFHILNWGLIFGFTEDLALYLKEATASMFIEYLLEFRNFTLKWLQ